MKLIANSWGNVVLLTLTISTGCIRGTSEEQKREIAIRSAKVDIQALANACRMYKSDTGVLPAHLDFIYSREQGGKGTNAYLVDRFEHDPWRNSYRLIYGTNELSILCSGPDKQWGTTDDLREDVQ